MSGPDDGALADIPEDPTPAPPEKSVEWAGQVQNAIYDLGVPDGIDLDAISPGNPNDDTRAMLDAEYARWLPPLAGSERQRPPGQRPGAPRVRTGQLGRSARAKRRAAYSRTQRLFKISRKRCARNVLSGTWEEEPSPVPMALQEPYWRGVFQTMSSHVYRRPPPKGPVEWSLVAPITVEDVTRAIKGMSDGAPGPDGRTLNDLKRLRREEVAAHYNLWLLAGYPPDRIRRGRTVLIPKETGADSPQKHRPITISDVILRCFHKVLASRFEATLPWNTHQKAFMRGDGVADSIWLLQTIIRQHQRTLQPLNIAFLDIKKAFDSVSHESLLLAAGRMGIPAPMLGYLGELYGDAWTVLRIGKDRSEPIKIARGVRQGDPLSVHLFNATIDWALDCLDPELGVMVGETRVNAGAFADDMALIARTPGGLQYLLSDLAAEFKLSGLEISAGLDSKSASLRIDVDGKKKMWIVNPHPHLQVFGQPIPAIDITGVQQYLGVPLSPMRTRADIAGKLTEGLRNISLAPLKPQQRMFILNNNLIPSLYHQLVLTANSKKYLSWLDRSVRAAVRSWLRLLHDTPKAYFHAKIFDGGLGIVTLEHQVPLMKIKRINRLWASNDPVIVELTTSAH